MTAQLPGISVPVRTFFCVRQPCTRAPPPPPPPPPLPHPACFFSQFFFSSLKSVLSEQKPEFATSPLYLFLFVFFSYIISFFLKVRSTQKVFYFTFPRTNTCLSRKLFPHLLKFNWSCGHLSPGRSTAPLRQHGVVA